MDGRARFDSPTKAPGHRPQVYKRGVSSAHRRNGNPYPNANPRTDSRPSVHVRWAPLACTPEGCPGAFVVESIRSLPSM
eukprot:scaffold29756_cov57-Phaeocystis_antarctica.AAC.1